MSFALAVSLCGKTRFGYMSDPRVYILRPDTDTKEEHARQKVKVQMY